MSLREKFVFKLLHLAGGVLHLQCGVLHLQCGVLHLHSGVTLYVPAYRKKCRSYFFLQNHSSYGLQTNSVGKDEARHNFHSLILNGTIYSNYYNFFCT